MVLLAYWPNLPAPPFALSEGKMMNDLINLNKWLMCVEYRRLVIARFRG